VEAFEPRFKWTVNTTVWMRATQPSSARIDARIPRDSS
jgi:hypothetical protein